MSTNYTLLQMADVLEKQAATQYTMSQLMRKQASDDGITAKDVITGGLGATAGGLLGNHIGGNIAEKAAIRMAEKNPDKFVKLLNAAVEHPNITKGLAWTPAILGGILGGTGTVALNRYLGPKVEKLDLT